MSKLLFLRGSFISKCCLPYGIEFDPTLHPYLVNTESFALTGILYGMLIVVRKLTDRATPPEGSYCVAWIKGRRHLLILRRAEEDSVWLDDGRGCKEFGKAEVFFEAVALYACSCELRGSLCAPILLSVEASLSLFRERAGMMHWRTDAHGYHVVSDEMRVWISLAGGDPDAWAGWGWIDFLHPEDKDAFLFRWSEAVETGKPYQNQGRICVGGVWLWMAVSGNPVHDAAGQIMGWEGFSHFEPVEKRLSA